MKVKKNSLWIVVVISIISISLAVFFPKEKLIYDLSIGVISGNMVAFFLILIEYHEEKKDILESFFIKSNHINKTIGNDIDLTYLILPFKEFFLNKQGTPSSVNTINSKIDEFIQSEKNEKILQESMDTIIKVSELSAEELGNIFSKYHSLFSINTSNDSMRKELFKTYQEIKDLLSFLRKKAFHFKNQKNIQCKDYKMMTEFLLEIADNIYNVEEIKENNELVIKIRKQKKYEIDILIDKILKKLNSDIEQIDYGDYLTKEIKIVND